ncbi:Sodium/nucleoside cotransporter 2 [Trichinella pseudospiralis]|uniref:Sodium/nucleoside cotransporter n=1 Tax=Trichinella pseudospiralis TaxID=6337 RepID=A0A0V1IJY0_TRIPS|nr:Sodium/nucleoside cotransporter 2 [Trichinella pseudospiralis]
MNNPDNLKIDNENYQQPATAANAVQSDLIKSDQSSKLNRYISNDAVDSVSMEMEQIQKNPLVRHRGSYSLSKIPMALNDMKSSFPPKLTTQQKKYLKCGFWLLLAIAYHIFFIFAVVKNYRRALALIVFTAIFWFCLIYKYIFKIYIISKINVCFTKNFKNRIKRYWKKAVFRGFVYASLFIVFIAIVLICCREQWQRLNCLAGIVVLVVLLVLMSENKSKINWRPVIWGFAIQFCIGLFALQWEYGVVAFEFISEKIVAFLDYAQYGAAFTYGFLVNPPPICGMSAVFAFSVLQAILYFGAFVALLYQLGVMQLVLIKVAWLVQITLGTTATESLNAVASIFLGLSEAPLLIKPYLSQLTRSEVFAIMCAGFASVAGSLFAAYVSFGACPKYILSASVMSAPASLACAKIVVPETEESATKKVENLDLPKGQYNNVLEAISNGACDVITVIFQIIANLIVFIAILTFINSVILWLGNMVDIDDLSLEKILGYIFFPIAFFMGVSDSTDISRRVEETMCVAELMGIKVVLNEFIAYQRLGEYVASNKLSGHSQMMATYALCSFANIGSIGIQLGSVGSLSPKIKPILAKYALRAVATACIASFITTCWAGILISEPQICLSSSQSACFNILVQASYHRSARLINVILGFQFVMNLSH